MEDVKQGSVSRPARDARRKDIPVQLSPWPRVARLVVLGMLIGLALGALTRWIDNLPEGWRSLALIGGPWLSLAFVLGVLTVRLGGHNREAATVGAIATVCAVLGYYGYMVVVEHQANAFYLAHYVPFWLIPALFGGALFGVTGAVWLAGQGRMKAFAVGLLSGVYAGEGGWTTLRFLSAHHPVDVVNAAELVLGLSLPVLLLRASRDRLLAYGTTIGLGLVGAICLRLISSLLTVFNRP